MNTAAFPPVVGDALFLTNHPGWSWRDLLEAPDELVRAMRLINASRPRPSDA